MSKITERAQQIPPFIVMDVLEKTHEFERQGRHIIHLEIGEPDFANSLENIREGLNRIEDFLKKNKSVQ